MIRTAQLNKDRYDVYIGDKYVGDATRHYGGDFRWHPFLSIYDVLESQDLLDIGEFLKTLNHETKTKAG